MSEPVSIHASIFTWSQLNKVYYTVVSFFKSVFKEERKVLERVTFLHTEKSAVIESDAF